MNECAVFKDARGDLNVPLRGGAESGEFAYVGQVNEDVVVYKSGKLNEGELLLEVENLSISGLPLYDVQTVIKNCKGPVRLKTVRQGKDCKGQAPHAKLCSDFSFFLCCLAIFKKNPKKTGVENFVSSLLFYQKGPFFNSAQVKLQLRQKVYQNTTF